MSDEPDTPILQCEECGRVWLPADKDRWRAYPIPDEGELGLYCPECAEREFGDQ